MPASGGVGIHKTHPKTQHTWRKTWPPYRIGKSPHGQNRDKIHQKYQNLYFLSIFDVFWGYFEGCCVFLSCREPGLSQNTPKNTTNWLFQKPAISGVLRFWVCFGAFLEGNKEHPKTHHTRKRRFSERSSFCVFGCVAFSGALCSPLI